ncbi:pyridoxamine 5'-phosphate oxidase family protein [Halalkalicoccus tibetensis]|uniref:Pyridoxamine 5'-phosphate oxidase family protein n=1 Tax=Halalkalicoccus tibetensis TaxID=175632 RepID=A0ABD5V5U7_9EURY
MEIVENTLDVKVDAFLDQPLFCFFAQQSDDGPRLSPLWFLWEEEIIWNVARLSGRSYPDRVSQYPQTAIAIVDFDSSTGRVEHVGMRGQAVLKPYDEDRAERLFQKYLGEEKSEWPEMFVEFDTDDYRLIKFEPETVVARDQSYPTQ